MQAYYKLQWKKISRSWVLYFSFVGSIVLMYLLSSIFTYGVSLPSVIVLNTVIIALFGFGSELYELKTSTVFKTIGGSGLTKNKLILSSVFFALTLVVLSSYWILMWAAIFDRSSISADTISFASFDAILSVLDDSNFVHGPNGILAIAQNNGIVIENPDSVFTSFIAGLNFYPFDNAIPWESFDWFTFNYSISISILLGSLVAVTFVSFSNSSKTYSIFAFSYLFIGLFAGGMLIPPRLGDDSEFVQFISWFYPHSYIVDFFSTSMGVNFAAPVIDTSPSASGNIQIIITISPWDFSYKQNVFNFAMPIVYAILFALVGRLNFRWS